DGKDGGQRCIRALLGGLADRRYIRVDQVPADASNRTGRLIHLLPRAFSVEADPGCTDPGTPDVQIRGPRMYRSGVDPDVQIREIDSLALDSKPDDDDGDSVASPSGEDGPISIPTFSATCAAQGQVEMTEAHPGPSQSLAEELTSRLSFIVDPAEKIERSIPGWVASVSRVTDLVDDWILDAINRAVPKAVPGKPGAVAQYANGCLSRWVASKGRPHVELVEAKRREGEEVASKAAKVAAERTREAEARKTVEAEATRSKEAASKARWDKLSEGEQ